MLARLFVIVGGLLVVALCSLLLAPFFVDWAGYRSAFEQEASRIIGQPVRVEGTAEARILPFPSVTFSNVVIDGPDGTPAARIAAFSMDAELAPFLSGEILIFDMRIEKPDIMLKLAENGALLWSLPQFGVAPGTTVSLENVSINQGRVTVEREGRDPFLFDGVNGKVSAQSLVGPWLAEGTFNQGVTTYAARLSTGAKEPGQTVRVRLSLSPESGLYDAAFDGRFDFTDGAPVYAGKLEATALGNTETASTQSAGGKRQPIADIKGEFVANADSLKITKASFLAGPQSKAYRADGSASVTFGSKGRFDVALKGQQISVSESEGGKSNRVSPGIPLANRLAAFQNLIAQIPVPSIPGRVDLELPALVLGDTIIRNSQIKAVPSKTGWQIESYSTELPGRTIVEGKGDLVLAPYLAFSGQMTLASKQPTGLANWLGLNASNAIRALPGAGFSSRIDLNQQRQTFRDFEFRAGAAVLRGLIDRQVPQGARAQISVTLDGENADLNVLSSLAGLVGAKTTSAMAHDIDLTMSSAPVSGFGFQAEKLTTVLRFEEGAVAIGRFDVTNMSGADLKLTGQISRPFVDPEGELNAIVSSLDPMPLIDSLVERFPEQAGLNVMAQRAAFMGAALADSALDAELKLGGKSAATSADYRFNAAGLRLSGTASINSLIEQDVSFALKGDADIGETVLAAMGVAVGDTITALQLLEPVTFDAAIAAKAGNITGGSIKALSNGDLFETSFGEGAQAFNLVLADAAPYAMTAGYALPGAAYGMPLKLAGSWAKTGSTLTLQKLSGTLLDVPVSGELALSQSERLKVTGNLSAQSIDRLAIDEIVLGPFAASGNETAELPGVISLPFDADVAVVVEEATGFTPFKLNKAKARIVATKEALRFVDFAAEIGSGKLVGAGQARKNGSETLINLNAVLDGADFATLYGEGISGTGNLQIELSAAGSTQEGLRSSLVGSGVVTGKNVVVDGLSTASMNSLIDEADGRETSPDTIATLDMVERKIMTGQTRLPQFQSAFTVTSGIVRAPRSRLKIDGGILAIEPKLDLNSGLSEIAAQLVFDAGDEPAAGTEPALNFALAGPWSALALTINPQALEGFLGQRALAREETRVEAIQSALLEKQRFRRENRYYAGLIEARARAEAERLAEIERAAEEAAKLEKEKRETEHRLKKEFEEKARQDELNKARQKEEKQSQIEEPLEDGALSDTAEGEAPVPASPTINVPLNLDVLIKQLETVPTVQP